MKISLALCAPLVLLLKKAFAQEFPPGHSSVNFSRDCVGRESEPLFALTFDDGPWSQSQAILDILHDRNASATFFTIASNFERRPADAGEFQEVVRRIVAEGHVLANHGITNDEFTVDEVLEAHEIINMVTGGYNMGYFRPAGGAYSMRKYQTLIDLGYRFALWNLDTLDWMSNRDPNDILALVESSLENPTTPVPSTDEANYLSPRRGSFVMLAHDNHLTMLKPVQGGRPLLAAIIDTVREHGYQLVTMDECVGPNSVSLPATDRFDQAQTFYCGSDFEDAATCRRGTCFLGMNTQCPDGLSCFSDVPCSAFSCIWSKALMVMVLLACWIYSC